MAALYNEIEPFAAQWLGNLARAGHIADGHIDTRSIKDVPACDVRGFVQCHFFAGIGVWSHALRLAGWSDDRSVWTGSCPCQPFSSAGKGAGFADERHLWPEWFRLIRECRPSVVFGEQVASPAGLAWLDAVFTDLEGAGYACGAADLCAASVGAPHVRQRLYFVANAEFGSAERYRLKVDGETSSLSREARKQRFRDDTGNGSAVSDVWSRVEWISCSDGKSRPIEPGVFPMADGAASRLGRLRAYGNAIVAEVAAEFIRAAMSAMEATL